LTVFPSFVTFDLLTPKVDYFIPLARDRLRSQDW